MLQVRVHGPNDVRVDEVAPPANMAGCSARMLQMVTAALDAGQSGQSS